MAENTSTDIFADARAYAQHQQGIYNDAMAKAYGVQAPAATGPATTTSSVEMTDAAKLNFLAKLTDTNVIAGIPMFPGEDFNRIAGIEDDTAQLDAIRELIGTKDSSVVINALEAANPAAKPLLDVARGDQNFATALKDAIVQDPTFLTVLNSRVGAPGSPIDMNAAATALQDTQTRANFTDILKQVAENPNLTGEQAFDVVESGIAAANDPTDATARNRYKQSLGVFNLQDKRIDAAGVFANFEKDPWGTFMSILQDPQAFADAMKALTGFQDGGMVAGLFNGLAGLTSMWTQDPYVQKFTEHYAPQVQSAFNQDLQVMSGTAEPDRIEPENPAPSDDQASTYIQGEPDRETIASIQNGNNVPLQDGLGSQIDMDNPERQKVAGIFSSNVAGDNLAYLRSVGLGPEVTPEQAETLRRNDTSKQYALT